MSQWETVIAQPGYFGEHRATKYAEFDRTFGVGKWQVAWEVPNYDTALDFVTAAALYEDAYFEFMRCNPKQTWELVYAARDVYDDAESNVTSGLDYLAQETDRTHVQDIAIRRSLLRLGLRFQGDKLIRIRDKKGKHPLSMTFSPGRIPFHMKELIRQPEVEGWWMPGSVECFYQSNKVIQRLVG